MNSIRRALALQLALFIATPIANAQQAVPWTKLSELDRATRSYVKLDEEESVKEVQVARVRLKDKTPKGQTDALFIHHQSSFNCGSAGCLLEVLMAMPDGSMTKVLDLTVNDVSLGKSYTKGVRNLRFDDSVTWVWNGKTFILK